MSLLTCSPQLVVACFHTWVLAVVHKPWWMIVVGFGWLWFIFVCGQPSSFVDIQLHFLGGHGGGVDMGCCWHQASCCCCHRWRHWVVVWWLVEEKNKCHML